MSITFISAGAGSGKTTRLMEIIADAIDRGIPPERIVATTFTVKAAEELKIRLQQKFLKAGEFQKASASSAIMVGTINSVCAKILSLFAFEAGMSPRLSVLDEEGSRFFLRKVIESTISDDEMLEFDQLERRFGIFKQDKSQWQDQVRSIIDTARSSAIGTEKFPAMAQKNADTLLHCIGVPLVDYDQAMIDLLDDAIPAMEAGQKQKMQKNTQAYLDVCKQLHDGLKRRNDSWDLWLKLESMSAGKNCDEWPDRVKELAASWKTHTRFHRNVRRYLDRVFTTASRAMANYDEEKKASGFLDFADQESKLYDLLKRDDVRARLAERMDLLVVDEFQDTSPIQLALFVSLSLLAKQTWWVGDVKQSIYGFRGSDSALMEGVLREFQKRGTQIEILGKSYRSRPSLVNWTNALFVPAFANELSADRVKLHPVRDEIPGPSVMHMILEGTNKETQTGQLTGGIIELYESGREVFDKDTRVLRRIRWGDIAVLARSHTDISELTEACKLAGIPLRSSGNGLLATPEAHLVLAALRRLYDQSDTLASAEILGLTEGLTPEDWLEERLEEQKTSAGTKNNLWRCEGHDKNPVLGALEELRPLANLLGPSALLDAVIARCGFDSYLLAWTPNERRVRERLANLEAVRGMVRQYEESAPEGTCNLAGLILWLSDQTNKADTLPESSQDGLSVITWHKAKGLEWPVVILHGSWKDWHDVAWNSIRALKDSPLDLEKPLEGSWIRFWPWPFGEMKTLGSVDVLVDPDVAELTQRGVKEELRLVYVGVTRARDLLVVVTTKKSPNNTSTKSQNLLSNPRPGQTSILLPDGSTVPYECVTPKAPQPKARVADTQTITWFDTDYHPADYPNARLVPSEAEAGTPHIADLVPTPTHAGTIVTITPTLKRTVKGDIRELGKQYHAAFAFFANNEEYTGKHPFSEEIRTVVLAMIATLKNMWPKSVFHTELSVQSLLDGRYIDARLDLLVETEAGFYIVDHKLSEKPASNPDETIAQHATQLSLYQAAVNAQAEKSVLGLWIALPQDGMLVEAIYAKPPAKRG
ncbi:MAG: UvrD-helicase domain-containing protein [Spirochaetales bacterium]|nr:UvrD-helicase domain-containing protein [Spirochaetales bacterium]